MTVLHEIFGNLFEFLPKSKLKAGEGKLKGKYPFFTSSNVQSKWIDSPIYSIEALVFGTGGSASVHQVSTPFSTSSDCLVAKPKQLDEINCRYCFHFISSNIHLLEAGFHGAGLKHISKKYIQTLEIPIPSLEDQRRIADILDRAETLRTKRRATLAQLDEIIQSIFFDMFGDPVSNPLGWKQSPLKHCTNRIQIGPFGSLLHKEDYVVGGIPLINPMHIENGKIIPDPKQSVTVHKHAELQLYHLQKDDVIMGRRGEMGRCAIVRAEQNGTLCGTGSLFIRPDERKATATYLQATLSSEPMRNLLERFSLGATLPNLNRGIVEKLAISLPPLDLQQEFSRRIAAVDRLKIAYKASLVELDELFSSLQHRAFRGEL